MSITLITPDVYGAGDDVLECKTWVLANHDDAYIVGYEHEVVQRHLEAIKARIEAGETYLSIDDGEYLEVQWD
jgi:hypothetical protein